ncbi:hypothetical protein LLE49_01360 [Alicyclobacillus tolerans]|uniref:hypothetical protein n=1 Tax=Alicyclobacillus tolerans TaxID=90970 RepID=UPI001F438C26|nr:hypothetical protein [Alicyclobacillus tolerans]MCF8563392.1 hypothetical protein [Alicyclobacillus tolerans]
MEQLFIVWYSALGKKFEGWLPSEAMTRKEAENFAANMQIDGYQTVIHPRHRVSRMEVVEG